MSINVIGAGLAGLSAAITLARENIKCNLISLLPSERAQSVLAEGGINGALNTMGEDDKPEYHMADTLKAGVYIADEEAVRGLTENAPLILKEMKRLGVPFNLKNEQIQQRNFGGQKKKRTAYAKSSTGKVLMTALIDEARKYEAGGLITRFDHHELADLLSESSEKGLSCKGVVIRDTYTDEISVFSGTVILAIGGMNGIFPGRTTGTVTNSGDAAALMFSKGVRFSNLEMIQYHPTTIGIAGKRCLVSEAARGEGGRLYIMRGGEKWYFMEEKYPELGNLMPRDVVAREMYFVSHRKECENQVWLDMHHLPKETWEKKLPDLRAEVIHYLGIDPVRDPIPVTPGIHYFMGGIDVDIHHRTNVENLYAAGECCSQYHGANRLGGNSTLGAIYGGKVAASDVALRIKNGELKDEPWAVNAEKCKKDFSPASPADIENISSILLEALGIVRCEEELAASLRKIETLLEEEKTNENGNNKLYNRLLLAKAMLEGALLRKESRGAHYRSDFPETKDEFKGSTISEYNREQKEVLTSFRRI